MHADYMTLGTNFYNEVQAAPPPCSQRSLSATYLKSIYQIKVLGSLLIHDLRVHSEILGLDKVLEVFLDLADFVDACLAQVSDLLLLLLLLLLMVTASSREFIHFIIIVIG